MLRNWTLKNGKVLVVGDADRGIVTLGSAAALGLGLEPDGWRVRLLVVPEPRAGS